MQETLQQLFIRWHVHSGLAAIFTLILLIIILWLISSLLYWVARAINKRYITPLLNHRFKTHTSKAMLDKRFMLTLIRLIPGFVFLLGSSLLRIPNVIWTGQLAHIIVVIALLYLLCIGIRVVFILLDIMNIWAKHHHSIRQHPIESYIQIIKIGLMGLGAIFAVSIIVDKSP